MKKIIDSVSRLRAAFLLLFCLFGTAMAMAQAGPQIPLSGSIGVPGSAPTLCSAAVVMPSDANFTLTANQFGCYSLYVTSSVSLTATRNIIAPLNYGQQFVVTNATTGGQSIQVIGASGTGVIIASGQTQIVNSPNGINYVVAGASTVTVPTTSNFLYSPSGTLAAVPGIFPVVSGGGGSNFNGIGITGSGGANLTYYVGTVVGQQSASSLNTHFTGAWNYDANGIAAAFRLLAVGGDSAFQVSMCPFGTVGTATAMDTLCVALFMRSNGSGNQAWLNSQLTNPTFPANMALTLNPSANWTVDFSGNETAHSVVTPSASVLATTVAGDVTTFDNTTGHLHDSGIPSSTLASTALSNAWAAGQTFQNLAVAQTITNGNGLQVVSGSGCTTAASLMAACNVTITLSSVEPNNTYTVQGCSIGGTPAVMGNVSSQTTTNFVVAEYAATASGAAGGVVNCFVTHQ